MGFIEHLHEKDVEPVLQPQTVIESIRGECKTIDRLVHDSSTALETKVRLINNKMGLLIDAVMLFVEEAVKKEEQ